MQMILRVVILLVFLPTSVSSVRLAYVAIGEDIQFSLEEEDSGIICVSLDARSSLSCLYHLDDDVLVRGALDGKYHQIHALTFNGSAYEHSRFDIGEGLVKTAKETGRTNLVIRSPGYGEVRHFLDQRLHIANPGNQAATVTLQVAGTTEQMTFSALLDEEHQYIDLQDPMPGSFSGLVTLYDSAGSVVSKETTFFEAVVTSDELGAQRFPVNSSMRKARFEAKSIDSSTLKKRRTKICFVGSLEMDGQTMVWLNQMKHLPKDRFEMVYMTYLGAAGGEVEERLTELGISLVKHDLPSIMIDEILQDPKLSSYGWGGAFTEEQIVDKILESVQSSSPIPAWGLALWSAFYGSVAALGPDILVVGNVSGKKVPGNFILTAAARQVPGCLVVMDLANKDPDPRMQADAVVAPSHFVAHHPGVISYLAARNPSPPIHVISPGTDASFSPDGVSICHSACRSMDAHWAGVRERGTHRCPPCQVVGFVGRLHPEKSLGLFVMAIARVHKALPFTRYVIIGRGDLEDALKELAAHLGVLDLIDFLGFIPTNELAPHLRGMDILVNTSLRGETFCITNIEAMASGVPVVAFGIGGMGEYLEYNRNGWLVDEPSPEALAHAIVMLLNDNVLRLQLGAAARATILEGFTASHQIDRYQTLYENLVKVGDDTQQQAQRTGVEL